MMFTKRDQSQTVSFCGSSFYKMMSIGFSGTNLLHTNPKVDTAPAARKWRGAAALKLAVMALAVVAVLAISGGFTTSNQVLLSVRLLLAC